MVATRLRPISFWRHFASSDSKHTLSERSQPSSSGYRPLSSSSGATMIEFVLVGAVFIFFCLAIMDFGRSLILQNIADTAAEQAAKQASVIEWLDTDCASVPDVPAGTRATCNANRQTAMRTVLQTARLLPSTTLFSPIANRGMQWFIGGDDTTPAVEIVLSANNTYRAWFRSGVATETMRRSTKLTQLDSPSTNPVLKRVLQSEPIEVNVRTVFKPVLGFLGQIPVLGRARAFREIRGVSSYPARVNCKGQEVPIGQPINNTNCPCLANPSNPLVIQQGNNCICVNPGMTPVTNPGGQVVTCICPPGQQVNGTSCQCIPIQCPPTQTQQGNCACGCPGSLTVQPNGNCGCPPNLEQNGNNCQCPAAAAQACTSTGGTVNGQCQCVCPGAPGPNGTCTCPNMNCGSHGSPTLQCGCNCTDGYTGQGNTCVCPTPRSVQANGKCECTNTCPPNANRDYWCNCTCPPPLQLINGSCQCPQINCNGGVPNSSCGCNCPSNIPCQGGSITGNCTCKCDYAEQTNVGGVCQCPSFPCNGGDPQPNCTCKCPENQILVNGNCQCPDGWFENPDGSCQIPE